MKITIKNDKGVTYATYTQNHAGQWVDHDGSIVNPRQQALFSDVKKEVERESFAQGFF